MQYYLDTNIVAFLLYDKKKLSYEVADILTDYSNNLYISSVCVMELVHLLQIGKLKVPDGKSIFEWLKSQYIEIVHIGRRHLERMATLSLAYDHTDPCDHLIISQAISDRKSLISSDTKFSHYQEQGLKFVFNKH